MHTAIAEIVAVFLIIAGCAGFVAAAALVSTALAVAVAAAFLLLGGVLLAYIAATLDRARKAQPAPRGESGARA